MNKRYFKQKILLMLKNVFITALVSILAVSIVENIRLKKVLSEYTQILKQDVNNKGGIKEHGRLTVKNNQLCDENGEPFVLKGMSSHGLTWYPEYTNYRTLKSLKEYDANVFRIAMYTEQNDGFLEKPELNKKLLLSAIENSLEADLYTIVDWHILKDKNPNEHIEEAKIIFEDISNRYSNNEGIIYEICNEPNGDTTYDDIVRYANEIIPIIRENSPNALILVGTPNYCTSLKDVIQKPLPFENIMYTYHFYAGVSDCKFAKDEISRALQNQVPIFISEWGIDLSEDNQQEKLNNTEQFLNFLDENKISWVNWSLSDKDESYSLFKPNNKKLYNWTKQDLTYSGQYVLERLKK